MVDATHELSESVQTVVLLNDKQEMEREKEHFTGAQKSYQAAKAGLAKFSFSPEEKASQTKIDASAAWAQPLLSKTLDLALADRDAEATALLGKEVSPAMRKWQAALGENVKLQEQDSAEQHAATLQEYGRARMTLIATGIVSVLVAIFLGLTITRSVTVPMADAKAAAQRVAAGDLTAQFQTSGSDETAELLRALEEMRSNLAAIVRGVRANAEGVATASTEISQGNNDLSARTEQQASALEQTAASMEQLSSTVRQNADNAIQANQLALSASSIAAKGGEVVSEVVQTMRTINEGSKKIADIIGVIDGIAFQTNILALNAAVEAARAGEQGRGFAVVAGEVRTLAHRSAQAAKEIKSLITTSVERVEHGSNLVDKAGTTMNDVVSSIKRVTDIMSEISAASREQSAGVLQIGEAVAHMDQATQQNAALVEQSAAAAESLKNQARDLVNAVEVFRVAA